MKYVRVPRELTSADIISEKFCFSPGRYVRFVPPNEKGNVHFVPLDQLVKVREESVKALKSVEYHYAEIGDINVTTGGVEFRTLKGYQLPTDRPAKAEYGDVLISTVRTYRKGVGLVVDKRENLVTTNAVLNLCGIKTAEWNVSLPYVYSFLRSDFFVEQVWSLLNRGVYPRMDTGALDKILIPITPDSETERYVSALAIAVAEKEAAIRERSNAIDNAILIELTENQKQKKFMFNEPTLEEIRKTGRLDASLYSALYRQQEFLIKNYSGGWANYKELGFDIGRGQNLQISCIGHSIYSDHQKPDFYRLVAPTDISEFRTVDAFRYLGNKRELDVLKRGDVIFGAEGFRKGRCVILVDEQFRTISNIHGVVFHPQDGSISKGIFFGCFLGYLRKVGIVDAIGAGGSGGSLAIGYLDKVPIALFSDASMREIVRLYHNPIAAPDLPLTVENFIEWHRQWNDELGLWELDREMKALQETLSDVQEKIIQGRSVSVPREATSRAAPSSNRH